MVLMLQHDAPAAAPCALCSSWMLLVIVMLAPHDSCIASCSRASCPHAPHLLPHLPLMIVMDHHSSSNASYAPHIYSSCFSFLFLLSLLLLGMLLHAQSWWFCPSWCMLLMLFVFLHYACSHFPHFPHPSIIIIMLILSYLYSACTLPLLHAHHAVLFTCSSSCMLHILSPSSSWSWSLPPYTWFYDSLLLVLTISINFSAFIFSSRTNLSDLSFSSLNVWKMDFHLISCWVSVHLRWWEWACSTSRHDSKLMYEFELPQEQHLPQLQLQLQLLLVLLRLPLYHTSHASSYYSQYHCYSSAYSSWATAMSTVSQQEQYYSSNLVQEMVEQEY